MNESGDLKRAPIAYILCGQLDQDQEDRPDPNATDLMAEAMSIRQEADDRLRIQSNELKRFHNKSCLRVTSRERHHRLQAQRAQKHLSAKCAKVFASTDLSPQSDARVKVQGSARSAFQRIRDDKRKLLKVWTPIKTLG